MKREIWLIAIEKLVSLTQCQAYQDQKQDEVVSSEKF
jgi:hypothetical protein